jgi:hypothetical protein
MANNIGNINPMIPQPNVPDLTAKKNKIPENPDTGANGGVIADKVEISKQAKAITKAMVKLNEIPEIRNEVVQKAIEERIRENQRIPAYMLAAKLLIENQ